MSNPTPNPSASTPSAAEGVPSASTLEAAEAYARDNKFPEQELLPLSIEGDHGHQAAVDFRIGFRYGESRALKRAFLAGHAHALQSPEVTALVEALREIEAKVGYCIFGSPDMSTTPEVAYRQGSHQAWCDTGLIAKEALAAFELASKGGGK